MSGDCPVCGGWPIERCDCVLSTPPFIVGIDMARGPDRSALMSWRDGARMVHELPPGAAVAFYKGKIIVVCPSLPPYTVDPETGAQYAIDFAAKE